MTYRNKFEYFVLCAFAFVSGYWIVYFLLCAISPIETKDSTTAVIEDIHQARVTLAKDMEEAQILLEKLRTQNEEK